MSFGCDGNSWIACNYAAGCLIWNDTGFREVAASVLPRLCCVSMVLYHSAPFNRFAPDGPVIYQPEEINVGHNTGRVD